MLGSTEIIVLVVVIGVLIFGAKKIPPNLQKHLVKPKESLKKEKFKETRN